MFASSTPEDCIRSTTWNLLERVNLHIADYFKWRLLPFIKWDSEHAKSQWYPSSRNTGYNKIYWDFGKSKKLYSSSPWTVFSVFSQATKILYLRLCFGNPSLPRQKHVTSTECALCRHSILGEIFTRLNLGLQWNWTNFKKNKIQRCACWCFLPKHCPHNM